MQIATLRTPEGLRALAVTDPRAEELAALSREGGNLAELELRGRLLEHSDAGEVISFCASVGGHDSLQRGKEVSFRMSDLAPVIPRPGKIICVGLNYARHILEMGRKLPEVPTLFIKYPEALTGPYDDVHIPLEAAGALDAESELAVIVGKRAHRISRDQAAEHIFGYSVINDYTLRDWQTRTLQFHQGKSYYQTAGFGPWITTAEQWQPGPRITATWGEEIFQDGTTDDLIFDCETLISFISQIYPLSPGDVIATGTPEGVGHARTPARYIRNGETVTCAIDGLGAISNTTFIDQ